MPEKIKKLWKPFTVFFIAAFLIINWNFVSWIFNYRAVSGYISDLFTKKDVQNLATSGTDTIPAASDSSGIAGEYSEKADSIEIPEIGIEAPLIVNQKLTDSEVYKSLNNGVVYYPRSVLPGEVGQTIILGHSAPPNWPHIKYDWVFSHLEDLTEGDQVFVYYDHRKLSYVVTGKIFLDRGEEVPKDLTNNSNVVLLISCWPPGKDLRRIAVTAALN